jgi:hypothetical protein
MPATARIIAIELPASSSTTRDATSPTVPDAHSEAADPSRDAAIVTFRAREGG